MANQRCQLQNLRFLIDNIFKVAIFTWLKRVVLF